MVSGRLTVTMLKSSGMLRSARLKAVGIRMMIFFNTKLIHHHPNRFGRAVGTVACWGCVRS
uniref:Uncharacterized protein n=1 Tax=Helianthus annuus TaxID=4232 RepID=A0A251U441_HELAN